MDEALVAYRVHPFAEFVYQLVGALKAPQGLLRLPQRSRTSDSSPLMQVSGATVRGEKPPPRHPAQKESPERGLVGQRMSM